MKAEYDKRAVLAKIQEVVDSLPPGWSKNNNGDGTAPFVHEDGRVSWKHPSRDEIAALIREMRGRDGGGDACARAGGDPRNARSRLKRYRMMLRCGIAPTAVEQKARVDGVDPALIYAEIVDRGDDEAAAATTRNNKNSSSRSSSSDDDGKREKSSKKCKVATAAAATTATIAEGSPAAVSEDARAARRRLKKYRMMLKAGVPVEAVRRAAGLEGVDVSVLVNACGIGRRETDRAGDDGLAQSFANEESAPPAAVADECHPWFRPPDGSDRVAFVKGRDLTRLVTKLVQTANKRATDAAGDLTVDLPTLYDALGSLKGVQHSRDVYNSTAYPPNDEGGQSGGTKIPLLEARSKRKPFLELATSLGMTTPSHWNDRVDVPGLDDLVRFVEGAFVGTLDSIRSQTSAGVCEFESLGNLYEPGTRVVATDAFAGGIGAICEVAWNRYERGRTLFGASKTFRACFRFVVAVGRHFTLAECVEAIDPFDGKRSVRSLAFVPLEAYGAEERERMVAGYSERGRVYDAIATSTAYMAYGAGCFHAKRVGGTNAGGDPGTAALHASGRIMIDTQGGFEAGHSVGTGHDSMVMGIKYSYKAYALQMRSKKREKSSAEDASHDCDMALFDAVPEDYLAMTWPAVVGFSFRSKVWGDVLVDGLTDIDFQEDIFDKLVLSPSRKRMVKALVKHSTGAFNDIVRGKGEGSVFLLYGKPGVGKTLTAEAICEMLHKPLYTVSLGQLGSSAAELEANLNSILTLCSRWGALVLLDEADIFLEKRSSTGSLERNAMVSVMLRLVEYFRGVLFLTSNRVDSLDPAFKTRITLALGYDSLDRGARKRIWTNLLESSGFGDSIENGDVDVEELAAHDLNGREIKNSIRLAMALAEEDGEALSQKILLETVSILNEFNDQMDLAKAY